MFAVTVSDTITAVSAFATGFIVGTASTLVLLRVLIPAALRASLKLNPDQESDAEETRRTIRRRNKDGISE